MEIKRLKFSQRSLEEMESISDYILNKWSQKSKDKFLSLLFENLKRISENPYLFSASTNKKNLFKCVVSKHTSIFYLIKEDDVLIVSVFDNRQNPNKTKDL
ncbi:MAG: type II toxin-antitoxin system RelE/ParE family toxin [Flavobacterium sp.]